jgi:hypothetical protein
MQVDELSIFVRNFGDLFIWYYIISNTYN